MTSPTLLCNGQSLNKGEFQASQWHLKCLRLCRLLVKQKSIKSMYLLHTNQCNVVYWIRVFEVESTVLFDFYASFSNFNVKIGLFLYSI